MDEVGGYAGSVPEVHTEEQMRERVFATARGWHADPNSIPEGVEVEQVFVAVHRHTRPIDLRAPEHHLSAFLRAAARYLYPRRCFRVAEVVGGEPVLLFGAELPRFDDERHAAAMVPER